MSPRHNFRATIFPVTPAPFNVKNTSKYCMHIISPWAKLDVVSKKKHEQILYAHLHYFPSFENISSSLMLPYELTDDSRSPCSIVCSSK